MSSCSGTIYSPKQTLINIPLAGGTTDRAARSKSCSFPCDIWKTWDMSRHDKWLLLACWPGCLWRDEEDRMQSDASIRPRLKPQVYASCVRTRNVSRRLVVCAEPNDMTRSKESVFPWLVCGFRVSECLSLASVILIEFQRKQGNGSRNRSKDGRNQRQVSFTQLCFASLIRTHKKRNVCYWRRKQFPKWHLVTRYRWLWKGWTGPIKPNLTVIEVTL